MSGALIKGGIHRDRRGALKYFNQFDMALVQRFYIIEHVDETVIRAWQGHQCEQKWFYVIEGAFKVVLVTPDDWDNPSENLTYEEHLLTTSSDEILNVPKGMATGFQALEPFSKLMIFSDATLNESMNDDYRFEKDLWYNW